MISFRVKFILVLLYFLAGVCPSYGEVLQIDNNFDGKEGTHILIKLFPQKNIKHNRLEIHRLVNKILIKEFSNGLHSLEIKIIN